MTSPVTVRHGRREDVAAIEALYRVVGEAPGGIARSPTEVTREYVDGFVSRSLDRGIILVAEFEGLPGIAGEVHAYRSELAIFRHVLGELTVAVHPAAQGRGIGRKLFERLLDLVAREHPGVTRVELVTEATRAG